MKQELIKVSIRDLFNGYKNKNDEGVFAYNGNLTLRPMYQREFIYNEKESALVIDTIIHGCCINLFQWAKKDDGKYECVDGQQRSISICEFVNNTYSIMYNNQPNYFYNLPKDLQEKILNYELTINLITGTNDEIKDWYKRINIPGKSHTEQEIRNASYCGPFLEILKKWLSKPNGIGAKEFMDYINGSPIRQDFLETCLTWYTCDIDTNIKDYDKNICTYMAKNVNNIDEAKNFRDFLKNVLTWVKKTFPNYRKEMKGLDWGFLYKKCKDNKYNSKEMEQKIVSLILDDEISSNKGIYLYLLLEDEKYLSKRTFDFSIKRTVYTKQNGICPDCGQHFEIEEMEGHHIIPWISGGKTVEENCLMICKKCHAKRNA